MRSWKIRRLRRPGVENEEVQSASFFRGVKRVFVKENKFESKPEQTDSGQLGKC